MSRNYTLKHDDHDLRDRHFFSRLFRRHDDLPEEVDLRPHMSPVVDQGQLGSCTANAIASGLGEFLQLKAGKPLVNLSRLFLYWEERNMEGTVGQDSGAMIRDGMKILQKIGCAPEADYPYDTANFRNAPSSQATEDAKAYRITEYHRIKDIHALKASLAEGYPAPIGIRVYGSFESQEVANTGIVPVPNPQLEQCLGGHAVCAVGYKTINNAPHVIVRNSWGPQWGDKGYFYLPETFFAQGFVVDMWTGR